MWNYGIRKRFVIQTLTFDAIFCYPNALKQRTNRKTKKKKNWRQRWRTFDSSLDFLCSIHCFISSPHFVHCAYGLSFVRALSLFFLSLSVYACMCWCSVALFFFVQLEIMCVFFVSSMLFFPIVNFKSFFLDSSLSLLFGSYCCYSNQTYIVLYNKQYSVHEMYEFFTMG